MKTRKTLFTLLSVFLSLSIIAQTPGVNYQAVLRDQAGDPMPGANVTLFISLIDDDSGDLIYKESHALTTNDLGMLNTLIGTGTVEEGIFEEIIGISNLSMQLQASIPGEPDIVDIGSSKVGGVPFALYGEDADADPDNELQSISANGDSLTISEMGGVDLNAINYWEKTDSQYVLLAADQTSRNLTSAVNVVLDATTGFSMLHLLSSQLDGMCVQSQASPVGATSVAFGGPGISAGVRADNMTAQSILNIPGYQSQSSAKDEFLMVEDGSRSAPIVTSFKGTNSDLAGTATFNGPSSTNLQITSLANNPNNGYLLLLNAQNENKAGIYIDETGEGVVYGSNVMARVASDPEAEYIYGSLVGDESAAYTRGTATLVDGVASVICPDHFQAIADPNSMTVTITPLSAESKGIAVVEKFPGGFKVKELHGGKGAYSFDYMVSCKRKGMENYKVEHKLPVANTVDLSKISAIKINDAKR